MKKTVVAILSILITSITCSSNDPNRPGEQQPVNRTPAVSQAEPAPKVYSDTEKAQLLKEARDRRIQSLKADVEELFHKEWKSELEGKNICSLEERLAGIEYLMDSFNDEYHNEVRETGEQFSFTYADLGLDEKTVRTEHLKALKAWTRAVADVIKNGSKIEQCGSGEGATDLNNHYSLIQGVIDSLDQYNLRPTDVDLTPIQLRDLIKLAVKKDYASYKEERRNGWQIDEAIRQYKLMAADIGATEEEYKELVN